MKILRHASLQLHLMNTCLKFDVCRSFMERVSQALMIINLHGTAPCYATVQVNYILSSQGGLFM